MARLSTPAKAALAIAAYFMFSVGSVASFNAGLPPQLERLLSAIAAPALLLMGVWAPLLHPLGLATGEWFAVPTLPGALVLTALYSTFAYLATALVQRLCQARHS
jgi:hypothetical protein